MLERSAEIRLQALKTVFEDIVLFGTMLEAEIIALYGDEALEGVRALKWIESENTELGRAWFGSNRGRKKVQGLNSYYNPNPTALLNALARRQAVKLLNAEGYRLVELGGLQGQVIRMKDARGRAVIVFARHGGYKSRGLHNAVDAFLQEEGRTGVRFVAFVEDVNDHLWAEKDMKLELRGFDELVN